jgi:hypothetical protein
MDVCYGRKLGDFSAFKAIKLVRLTVGWGEFLFLLNKIVVPCILFLKMQAM